MKPYLHKVQYYETDRMGVTHHTYYLHWMEEARIDFMDQLGFPYGEMEENDVLSPVKSVACEYKHPSTFEDEISITVAITAFNGVVLALTYEMLNRKGETVCTAKSEHIFLHRDGRFVRMKRELPEFCKVIEAVMEAKE